MKIVYSTSESYLDHSYTIIKELRKYSEIVVYLQAVEENIEIKNWCHELNAVFIKRYRFRNVLSFWNELRTLLKIRKNNADVVWFNTLTFYQIFLVRFFIRKFLVMVHDVDPHPGQKNLYVYITAKLNFLLAKKNLCVASETQAELFFCRFGFRPKVFQLPVINYYSEVGIKPAGSSNSLRKYVNFFSFGTIESYKGIDLLIGAAEILEQEGLDFRVNIYGKLKHIPHGFYDKLNNLRNTNLVNSFIDYREIKSLYINNDVLILPYRQVTQCGPLLIGYSEGKPCICSDLPGFREYVADGKSGLIFDGTVENLALKMRFFINNPETVLSMKEFITRDIQSKFSMRFLAEKYISNFRNA